MKDADGSRGAADQTPPLKGVTLMASLPAPPLTVTLSSWPSATPEPNVPSRSIFTPASARSVPVRSLTTTLSAPPRAWKSICSTSLRSIVTLAMSRKKRTRSPLAEMSMFSAILAPLNIERVDAGLTLDGVVVVARVPDEHVVARAEQRHVVAVAAEDEVVALAAEEHIVPSPPLSVRAIAPAGSAEALITSSPAPPLMISWSAASEWKMATGAGVPVIKVPP